MGNFGWTEMFFIVAFALIVFGPRKLPEIAKTLGHAMATLRRASDEFKRTWEAEVDRESAKIQQPMLKSETATTQATTNQTETSETETSTVTSNDENIPAGMPESFPAGTHGSGPIEVPVSDGSVNIARGRIYNDIIPEPEMNQPPSRLGAPDPSTADQPIKSDEKHPVSIA